MYVLHLEKHKMQKIKNHNMYQHWKIGLMSICTIFSWIVVSIPFSWIEPRSHRSQMSDAIPQKHCHDTKLHLTCIESENDLLGPQGQSYACSQKKEGCVAKLLSAAITHTRPFNLHLDIWKSRSWEIKVLLLIFLWFETDLDFWRPWFSEIKVQIKRPTA